jgi:hypothetical protein
LNVDQHAPEDSQQVTCPAPASRSATSGRLPEADGRAILFDLNCSQQVTDMIAGDATYLKATYLSGAPDFC